MIAFLHKVEAKALADGFSGVRVIIEKTWLLELAVSGDRLIEYEVCIDQTVPTSRIVLICQYNRAQFGPAVIHDVLRTHSLIILGDQVCPNPFYEPPELAQGQAAQPGSDLMAMRVAWRIGQLKKARAAAGARADGGAPAGPFPPAARNPGGGAPPPGPRIARRVRPGPGRHHPAPARRAGPGRRRPPCRSSTNVPPSCSKPGSRCEPGAELRPALLDTLGLEATLRWLAEHHQQQTGCEVQLVGHLSGRRSPDLAIACFRVVQEALTNVVRHAAARHVWIELSQSDSVLELVVRDDGVGFDVAAAQEQAGRRGRLGLLGMAERVQILGGRLDVESQPGRGARIRASFPLSEASEEPADPKE